MAEEKKAEEKQDGNPNTEKPDENKEANSETKEAPKEEKEPKTEKPKEEKAQINYVHAALLLHSANKEINESNLKRVIEATGVSSDSAQIKALVSSLEGLDIEEAISQSVTMVSPVAAPAEEKKAEKKEDPKAQEKKAEEAASGLASLFG